VLHPFADEFPSLVIAQLLGQGKDHMLGEGRTAPPQLF